MCGSTCFGRLPAHHQEHTTTLGASGFTVGEKRLEQKGSSRFSPTVKPEAPSVFWYFLTVHLSIIYSLFPTWYTAFLFTYNNCCLLSSTCFRPHRPIIRRSKLRKQPMVFSPSADVFVVRPLGNNSQRPHDKDICRGKQVNKLTYCILFRNIVPSKK